MENREKRKKKKHEKGSPNYESEKANKVINDLKLNVDRQQGDIKHSNEQLNACNM